MGKYLQQRVILWRAATKNPALPGLLARIFHERPTATADMGVFPGVLGPRTLRPTVKYGVRVPAVARLHAHLHGLVTKIHELSGLGKSEMRGGSSGRLEQKTPFSTRW